MTRHGWRGYESDPRIDYGSREWAVCRRAVLPALCVLCDRNGIAREASHVDHILRVSLGGAPYDLANLQPLCASCHRQKTAHELTGRGFAEFDASGRVIRSG